MMDGDDSSLFDFGTPEVVIRPHRRTGGCDGGDIATPGLSTGKKLRDNMSFSTVGSPGSARRKPFHDITNSSLQTVSPAGSRADGSLLLSSHKESAGRTAPQYSPAGALARGELDRTDEMQLEDLAHPVAALQQPDGSDVPASASPVQVQCAKRSPITSAAVAAAAAAPSGGSRRGSSGGGERESLYNRIIQVCLSVQARRCEPADGCCVARAGRSRECDRAPACCRTPPFPSPAPQRACSDPRRPLPCPAPRILRPRFARRPQKPTRIRCLLLPNVPARNMT